MGRELDIHDYEKQYESTKKLVAEAPISKRNKNLIFAFEETAKLERQNLPSRIGLMSTLCCFAKFYLKKDFDTTTKEDLKKAILEIESKANYTSSTKQHYKAAVKKFYKWLVYGDDYRETREFPEQVKWINTSLKRNEKPKINPSEIFTIEDIDKLMRAAEHPRDKAFIMASYELGSRIGEIGNVQIKDLISDDYGFQINLDGKTGQRNPRLILSAPYLTNWLNSHPNVANKNAPLWVKKGGRKKEHMKYGSYRHLVKRLAIKAGITKRVYTHLFRHSRVTHVLVYGLISEAQAKVFFGWEPDSRMLSEYAHLVSKDVNDILLEKYGLKKPEPKEKMLEPKICHACKTINAYDACFCQMCSQALGISGVNDVQKELDTSGQMVSKFLNDPEVQQLFKRKIMEMGNSDKLVGVHSC